MQTFERSVGTLTTAPLMPFCAARGRLTIFMKGIRFEISWHSRSHNFF